MAEINKNPTTSRWEAIEAGEVVGWIDFHEAHGVVSLDHTEVPRAHAGKGIAGELVAAALADVRANGQQVRPVCPYVASWIDKHPDQADLVHTEWS